MTLLLSLPGVLVADTKQAFEASVAHGAVAVQSPTILRDEASGKEQTVAEILLYGDCVLRFVSGSFTVGLPPILRSQALRQLPSSLSLICR